MAQRKRLTFSEADLQVLSEQRYEHPDPRVQQRLEVLWLISQGLTRQKAAQLAGVSRATAQRYITIYRQQGINGLQTFHWCKPVSELEKHRHNLAESFTQNPPHTVAEACQRIEDETGVKRRPTQVRAFLKKCLD
jgi:transposase